MAKETIVPKCEYCKNNEGENKKFGFMWHCKPLGYCVPFGWYRCEASYKSKGGFELESIYRILEKSKLQSNMSKVTTQFQEAIKAYLDDRAANDALFAIAYNNPDKNINNCITYILNTVQTSGKNGFADDEVYNMAVHYYDEKDIEVGEPINAQVIINKSDERSSESKTETTPSKPKIAKVPKVEEIDDRQLSLF